MIVSIYGTVIERAEGTQKGTVMERKGIGQWQDNDGTVTVLLYSL
jgi:hypothetical protein